ncbi:MAG: hypothetical protein AAGF84_02035 [Planctomycetota bacterium]
MGIRIARFGVGFCLSLCFALGSMLGNEANASLTVYYDPGTGNVAFDTASTPTGRMTTYQFLAQGDIFRPENHVRISDAVGFSSEPHWVSDRVRPGDVLTGYFTIGEVFPAGLTEDQFFNQYTPQIDTYESDISNLPNGDRLTSFIGGDGFFWEYGQPDRPYDNYWDTVDLDTLDWAESALIGYDRRTGELWLDTTGPNSGYISTLHLVATQPVFNPDAFVQPFETPLVLADATTIAVAAGYPVEPGLYSLGRVLAPGLSPDVLSGMFDTARFLGKAGVEGSGFDFEGNAVAAEVKHFQSLPEPGATLMVAAAAMCLLRRRGRCVSC